MAKCIKKQAITFTCLIPKNLLWCLQVQLSTAKRKNVTEQLLYIIRTLPDHRNHAGEAYYTSKIEKIKHYYESRIHSLEKQSHHSYNVVVTETYQQQVITCRATLLQLQPNQFLSLLARLFIHNDLKAIWGIEF